MYRNEIKVKVNGGYLVAGTNTDDGCTDNGIYVTFETDEGDIVDIVMAVCNNDRENKIDVYCYEDVYTEDVTRQHTLDIKEIYKALYA